MTSNADKVAQYNQAVASTRTGKKDVEEFTYSYWYKSNWGDMLVPAPMAVSILGQLTLVATAADFDLVEPLGGFKKVAHKKFRATMVQLVDAGGRALQNSYKDMDEIQKRCEGIKPGVNNIVGLLTGTEGQTEAQNNKDITMFLPRQLQELQSALESCLAKAREMDDQFASLLDLTMEVHESCTATQGENDARIKDATMRQKILESQAKAAEEAKELERQHLEDSKKSYEEAQQRFTSAYNSLPTGWDMVGMQFVEGLSKSVLVGINAKINEKVGRSQDTTATQNDSIQVAMGNKSTRNQASGLNTPDTYDPAYQLAECIRLAASSLEQIATGGPKGGVDWDAVESLDNSGLGWIKGTLQTSLNTSFGKTKQGAKRLDKPSQDAKRLLETGVKLCTTLNALKATKPKDRVQAVVSDIDKFSDSASTFATESQLKTNTGGLQAPGFDQPTQPPQVNGSDTAASMAVKTAQFRIESSGTQLTGSRDAYEQSTKRMLEVTKSLGDIMGQIASLDMQKIDWEKIRAILIRAIAFLCQLKGCIADLVHFFSAVNNTIKVSMGTTMSSFIGLIKDSTQDVSLGGVSLSNWVRQAIYNQALAAAKIGRLVQNISQLYVKMYDMHIQKGVTMLLNMNSSVDAGSEQGVVSKSGKELQEWALEAQGGIKDLLQAEQSKFEADVNARVQEMQESMAGILPKPAPAVTKAITDATDAHVGTVTKQLTAASQSKAVYNRMSI